MNIFPLGTVADSSDSGTIDSIVYNMFEPNAGCSDNYQFDILSSMFQNKIMLTRKKSEKTLVIEYRYDNIYDREYRQIEHFLENVDESLTSFFVVDFSKGQTPSSITNSSGDWVVAIDNTRLYSTITNQKAYKAILKYGTSWKEGTIISLSLNTSITVDVDTNNYGGLSLANANSYAKVYPMYEVYAMQNSVANFKTTVYIPEMVNILQAGGWMRSGNISFVSKYKV